MPDTPPAFPTDLAPWPELASGRFAFLGPRLVRRIVTERRVPVYKLGGRNYVSAADLAALVASSRQPAAGAR